MLVTTILSSGEGFLDSQEIYGGHSAEGVEDLIKVGDGEGEGGFGANPCLMTLVW